MAFTDKILPLLIKQNVRGKDRLFSLLLKLGFRSTIIFNANYNIKLNLNPYEYIDSVIIKEGFYESEVTDEILKHLGNGDTFWDIGANIGIHSIAVKKNNKAVNVYSFEPNPKTVNSLCDNVQLNTLDINICSFALYNTVGSMKLHVVNGNSGMSTLNPWHEIEFTSGIQCLTTTGDILVDNGFHVPTVIKIDTEGSELNVLKGLKSVLNNDSLKAIIYEANNDLLESLDTDEIAIYLKENGFNKLVKLSRNEKTSHGLSNYAVLRS